MSGEPSGGAKGVAAVRGGRAGQWQGDGGAMAGAMAGRWQGHLDDEAERRVEQQLLEMALSEELNA